MEKEMGKLSNRTDENDLRSLAQRQGFKLRRDVGDHCILIDATGQVAFEGSAVGSLDDIRRILIEIESFDHFGNDFGLGDAITPFDGIAIDDEDWRASDIRMPSRR
jgi:hypothetical protein